MTTRVVAGHYTAPDLATPAEGRIELQPNVVVSSTLDNAIIPIGRSVDLDANGNMQIEVVTTDSPGLTPTSWAYRVTEIIHGAPRRTYLINVPTGAGPLQLADVAPLQTAPELVQYVLAANVGQVGGPAGPLDEDGLIPADQIPGGGGGGGTPSSTVVAETTAGQSANAGAATTYSRGDHTHGTPPLPTPAAIGAATSGHNHSGTYDPAGAASAAVSAHVAASDPHGDRAAAASALAAHEADTTGVHGISDTSALETTSGATAKVTAHTNATDPHGDRSYTDTAVAAKPSLSGGSDYPGSIGAFNETGVSTTAARSDHTHSGEVAGAVTTHAGASDPHGDRAYTDTAVAGRVPTSRTITAGTGLAGGGDLTANRTISVADRGLLTRDAMAPSGRYETRSRLDSGVGSSGITSGTLYLVPIWLPNALAISNITFVSGTTAGATLSHQWFALFNNSRVMLAVTTNDTSTAWGSNSAKTLAIATIASGSASSFQTTYEGLHYLGLMVTATTTPSIHGGGSANLALAGATPGIGGSNTGQTTVPAFPFTANAPSQGGPLAYAYVT